jgi:hypothetical protein
MQIMRPHIQWGIKSPRIQLFELLLHRINRERKQIDLWVDDSAAAEIGGEETHVAFFQTNRSTSSLAAMKLMSKAQIVELMLEVRMEELEGVELLLELLLLLLEGPEADDGGGGDAVELLEPKEG